MSANNNKGPIIDPGLCRCCRNLRKCRILNVEYEFKGRKEIYSEIILDCLGISLSHLDGKPEDSLICATCVVRLRDAKLFRQQVLECEEKLLKSKIHEDNTEVKVKPETEPKVKIEIVYLETQQHDELNNPATHSGHDIQSDDKPLIMLKDKDYKAREVREVSTEKKQHKGNKVAVKMITRKNTKERRELLMRMKVLREYLNKTRRGAPVKNKMETSQPRVIFDKEKRSSNAIAIVESSYVCPFETAYNDYRCVYCREVFANADEFREHTLQHNPRTYHEHIDNNRNTYIDINRIDCRLCEASIDTVDALKAHLTSAHNRKIHDVDNDVVTFKLKTGKLKCTACDKKLFQIQRLKQHMAEHFGNYICDECGSHFFDEFSLKKHKLNCHNPNAKKRLYRCKLCFRTFKSNASIHYHVSRVHGNKPTLRCNKCDKTFSTYHLRLKHKMEEHGEQRLYPCDTCGVVFNIRQRLSDHNRISHLQKLQHACTYCDMKFYTPSALKRHVVSHTGERNFRCEVCGKTYPRQSALKCHLDSHNVEKKYPCTVCAASYTQLHNFKNHLRREHQLTEWNGSPL